MEVCRSVRSSIVKKPLFKSSRSTKLRQWAQEILYLSCQGDDKQKAFEKFSSELIGHLKLEVDAIAGRYKSSSELKEHLWSRFHMMQWKGMLSRLWKKLMDSLNMDVHDSLLE